MATPAELEAVARGASPPPLGPGAACVVDELPVVVSPGAAWRLSARS